MKRRVIWIAALVYAALLLGGCSSSGFSERESVERQAAAADSPAQPGTTGPQPQKSAAPAPVKEDVGGDLQKVSQSGETAAISAAAMERRIIRNARLTIEVDAPGDAQQKITAIAERLSGFVVSSELKQNDARNAPARQTVTVVARVPAAQFNAALEGLRAVGRRVVEENVSGQDVTQEYIDLEARIHAKKALEAQFLEIMKQARKVSEALEVQREISEVRAEIEQMEGRRRYLENQSAFSTLTAVLQTPAPVVTATTSGFWASVQNAFGDGVDMSAEIVLGLIRLLIVAVPITLFIILPLALLARFALRRLRASSKSEVAVAD